MQVVTVALFVLGAAAVALALPTSGTGGCPGGYAEGAEIERGRLIYVCQGGKVVPKGCIAEDLSRITVGSNYDNKYYRRACVAAGDALSFEAIGCVQNGQVHKAGDTWDDGSSFFTCKLNAAGAEPALAAVNQGCVDGGKRIPKKEKVNKDDAVYICDETVNGGSKLIQGGCVKEGKAFAAGDAIEAGKAWFNCTRTGREKYTVKAAGCIQGGKRLNEGDRYVENNVFFECLVEGGQVTTRATGCQQTDGGSTIERKLGCTWVQGSPPLQLEVQCVVDTAGNTAKVVHVRCNYNVGGGVYNIEGGTYRSVGNNATAGCVKNGETLSTQAFPSEAAAVSAGLRAS